MVSSRVAVAEDVTLRFHTLHLDHMDEDTRVSQFLGAMQSLGMKHRVDGASVLPTPGASLRFSCSAYQRRCHILYALTHERRRSTCKPSRRPPHPGG